MGSHFLCTFVTGIKALYFFFFQYWGLNSGPTPRDTPPALFREGFFFLKIGSLQTEIQKLHSNAGKHSVEKNLVEVILKCHLEIMDKHEILYISFKPNNYIVMDLFNRF
jgi:hypothetical protein